VRYASSSILRIASISTRAIPSSYIDHAQARR
jgi:hypothetical protein